MCRSTLHIVGEQVSAEIENCNEHIKNIQSIINNLRKGRVRYLNLRFGYDQEVEFTTEEAIVVLNMALNRWKKQLDKALLHRHKVKT